MRFLIGIRKQVSLGTSSSQESQSASALYLRVMPIMPTARFSFLLSIAAILLTTLPVHAGGVGDLSITDGMGEEFHYKNPLLGKKVKVAKDRLGNSYVQEEGLLGSKSTELSLLGNRMQKKKGLFGLGGTQVEGSSILGDKIVSKKGFFGLGRRKTQVDLSGSTRLIKGILNRPAPTPAPSLVQPYSPQP